MADTYAWRLDIDDTRICFARKAARPARPLKAEKWIVDAVLFCDDVDSMLGRGFSGKLTHEPQEFTITTVKKEV